MIFKEILVEDFFHIAFARQWSVKRVEKWKSTTKKSAINLTFYIVDPLQLFSGISFKEVPRVVFIPGWNFV